MQMVTEKLEGMDVWLYHGQIYIPNTYSAGAVGSRFLTTLRDKAMILGMRCSKCNRVYVPARSVCTECFAQIDEWVDLDQLFETAKIYALTALHYLSEDVD